MSDNFKVVMVTGMRQTGKTTLLKSLSGGSRAYVTMDDTRTLKLAKDDPYLFFETHRPPLFIDEIQYAPELFPHIKMIADGTGRNGLIWMTGSQQFLLMKGVAETLAGRMAIIDLYGFSLYELMGKGPEQKPFIPSPDVRHNLDSGGAAETFEIIWRGAFPDMAGGSKDWGMFYSSYVKTYIERDVRQLANIGDELSFFNFLKIIAARTAQELNMSEIAGEAGVSVNTVKSWLSVLRASGAVYLLQPYHSNISKRLVKRPKLHFMDTGLAAFLTEWNTPETLSAGAMSGAIFETFVFAEILKSYAHNGIQPNFYYYRDSNRAEIDLVISQDGTLYPVEIKKTANPSARMTQNFKALEKLDKKAGYGTLVCLTDTPLPMSRSANAISVWNI